MRRLALAITLALSGGGVAFANNTSNTGGGEQAAAPSTSDAEFVQKAAIGGLAEVKMAKLAIERAQAPEVKQFARKMLADHTKANTELKRIADKKGMQVPTQLDADQQKNMEKLSSLTGADFDKAYMSMMVDDHRTDVAEFRQQAERGSDPDLKQFAMRTLPTLEHHMDMAKTDKAATEKEKSRM